MCNLWTRKDFETEKGGQVDDEASQLLLSVGNPSLCFNFIPSQKVERMEGADFFQVRLDQ